MSRKRTEIVGSAFTTAKSTAKNGEARGFQGTAGSKISATC